MNTVQFAASANFYLLKNSVIKLVVAKPLHFHLRIIIVRDIHFTPIVDIIFHVISKYLRLKTSLHATTVFISFDLSIDFKGNLRDVNRFELQLNSILNVLRTALDKLRFISVSIFLPDGKLKFS